MTDTSSDWNDVSDSSDPTGRVNVVEPKPGTYPEFPDFEWRRPVIYDHASDTMHVGAPSMEHMTLKQNLTEDPLDPWDTPNYSLGFIDTDKHVGEGGLNWFATPSIPNEEDLHNWVEQQYGVRNTGAKSSFNDDDAWTDSEYDSRYTKYYPAEDEVWAADDSPDFSLTIPESRWSWVTE